MGLYNEKTIKKLFALSGNVCAFPECETPIIDKDSESILGEICHIKARNPNGPRYDSSQTDRERNAFDNLILMCSTHHKVIDDNENIYTVERLHQIKTEHLHKHLNNEEVNDYVDDAPRLLIAGSNASLVNVTSHNQSGGQTANSITNIETNIEGNSVVTNNFSFTSSSLVRGLFDDLEKAWKATLSLLFEPSNCFSVENDTGITCEKITAFKYWCYILILELILVLIAFSYGKLFSIWFFIVQSSAGVIRLGILCILGITLGRVFTLNNSRHIISFFLFWVAISSLMMYIPLSYLIAQVDTNIALPCYLQKMNCEHLLPNTKLTGIMTVLLLAMGVWGYIIGVIYLSSIFIISKGKAFWYLISVSLLYFLLRPFLVKPLLDIANRVVFKAPWLNG